MNKLKAIALLTVVTLSAAGKSADAAWQNDLTVTMLSAYGNNPTHFWINEIYIHN